MTKIKNFRLASALFVLLTIGCKLPEEEKPKFPPKNIVVILDTSNRISKKKNPGQLETDTQIVKYIVDIFADLVLSEIRTDRRDTWLRHRFAIDVPPQPNTTQIPQSIIDELNIWPTPDMRKTASAAKFKKVRDELFENLDKLWQEIDKQNKFTGADIWTWFAETCKLYLKEDMANYIICLSDGYLDFDKNIQERRHKHCNKTSYIPYKVIKRFWNNPDWRPTFNAEGHGLLEFKEPNFEEVNFKDYDVKFLMVEMKRRDERDNMQIIETYWKRWLVSMGIEHPEFLTVQSNRKVVKEKILNFIKWKESP